MHSWGLWFESQPSYRLLWLIISWLSSVYRVYSYSLKLRVFIVLRVIGIHHPATGHWILCATDSVGNWTADKHADWSQHSSSRSVQANKCWWTAQERGLPPYNTVPCFSSSSQSFVSLCLLIFSCQQKLGLRTSAPRSHTLFFFLLFFAFGAASVQLPPAIMDIRESSEVFGHVGLACLPRAVSQTIGGYLK